jgi:hypothetical protein
MEMSLIESVIRRAMKQLSGGIIYGVELAYSGFR